MSFHQINDQLYQVESSLKHALEAAEVLQGAKLNKRQQDAMAILLANLTFADKTVNDSRTICSGYLDQALATMEKADHGDAHTTFFFTLHYADADSVVVHAGFKADHYIEDLTGALPSPTHVDVSNAHGIFILVLTGADWDMLFNTGYLEDFIADGLLGDRDISELLANMHEGAQQHG